MPKYRNEIGRQNEMRSRVSGVADLARTHAMGAARGALTDIAERAPAGFEQFIAIARSDDLPTGAAADEAVENLIQFAGLILGLAARISTDA